MSVFIIAEGGSSHDGELWKARKLVETAARKGADACKVQFWSSAERLAERRHAHEYLEMYLRYQLPAEWLPILREDCDRAGIEFMATAYLPEDIGLIDKFVKRFKIASFEAQDEAFVLAHLPYNKPVMVSTGMMDHETVERQKWARELYLLHCVSAYPASPDEMNLSVISKYGYHGLSDHTESITTGGVAIGVGAKILEKHFRLDDTDPANPDFPHSLTPEHLGLYIQCARFAERLMGDGVKRPMPSEEAMSKYLSRGDG